VQGNRQLKRAISPNEDHARPGLKANMPYSHEVVMRWRHIEGGPSVLACSSGVKRLDLWWTVRSNKDHRYASERRTVAVYHTNTNMGRRIALLT
jgi:hypothetical protein